MKTISNLQEELFFKECKLINLHYEYSGYTGKEQWAIITELSEKDLWEMYPQIIQRYTPFVLLSIEHGEVIKDSHRNDDKFDKRAKDFYGYEEGTSERHKKDFATEYIDPLEQQELELLEFERELESQTKIEKVRKTLSLMKPIQRIRLLKEICRGMSSREIALEEGVNYSSVDKSLKAARKNFKKIYENL